MKTRTAAIRHARSTISALYPFSGQWCYSWQDPTVNAYRSSIPRYYWDARFSRSEALVNAAREYLGLPAVQYDGGAWGDYI